MAATPRLADARRPHAARRHRSQALRRGRRSTRRPTRRPTPPASGWWSTRPTRSTRRTGRRSPSCAATRSPRPPRRPLTRLLDDGDAAGLGFKIASAFRSYDYQRSVHDATVAAKGAAEADRISARPGVQRAPDRARGRPGHARRARVRLRAVLRHDARGPVAGRARLGATASSSATRPATRRVTGYAPEPWHLRYVGAAARRGDARAGRHDAGEVPRRRRRRLPLSGGRARLLRVRAGGLEPCGDGLERGDQLVELRRR